MVRSVGSAAPAASARVGRKSVKSTNASETRPPRIAPGHEAMNGTRVPPSVGRPLSP